MAIQWRGLVGNLVLRWARRILTRRHLNLATTSDDFARRWVSQARQIGRAAQVLEMDGAVRLGTGSKSAHQLPNDAEILHRPSILSVLQDPAGHVQVASGTAISADVSLHHDMSPPHIVTRQIPRGAGQYDLAVEFWDVQGSFASLALALPASQVSKIAREDLIRLDFALELEHPCDVFARLNLAHGPNNEQIVRQLDLRKASDVLEFDIHYTEYDPTRAREIWIDLIFNTRAMNKAVIRDLMISRRPRLSL